MKLQSLTEAQGHGESQTTHRCAACSIAASGNKEAEKNNPEVIRGRASLPVFIIFNSLDVVTQKVQIN